MEPRKSGYALIVLALVPVVAASSAFAPAVATCDAGPPAPPCNHWASRLPLGPANEVHVAVDPTDPLHFLVVAKDYALGANGDCASSGQYHVASAAYVTWDGGETWATSRVPSPYPNGGAEASPLPNKCGSDPIAVFGPDGTAYYVLLNFHYTGGRRAVIAVARSNDGGATWPASDIRVLHSSSGDDKEWGAADGAGRLHVVWADLAQGRILYARTMGAFEFEAPRILATIGSGNPAVTVATGPADEVYVFWRDGASIKFTKSLDHGSTFATVRTAFTTVPYETSGPPRLPFMPQLAVDRDPASPYAGRIYVAWPDARDGDSAAYLASSGDGGLTWTAAVRVDDNTVAGRRQVMPTASVAPGGRVDVAWLDERDAPSLALVPGTLRAYASASGNAGATWAANRAVSEVPLVVPWSHHQNGSPFVGDYIGIASTADAGWVAFPGNGADRLAEGLPPGQFQRADAYLASAGWRGVDVGGPPPAAFVVSEITRQVPRAWWNPAEALPID